MEQVGRTRSRSVVAVVIGVSSLAVSALAGTIGSPNVGAAPPGFVVGEATASADTVSLKLALGNANIGFTMGRGIAHYQESSATADARAIDLEALPVLFGEAGACEGKIPFLPNAALPPETSVESEQAGSEGTHRTQAFFPELQKGQSTIPAGFQDAKATKAPYSWAATETPTQDLGIFKVWNARTQVTSQMVDNVREAVATTTADAIWFLGGALVVYNPKWEATARSGAVEQVSGSFTMSSAKLFGVPRSSTQGMADLKWFGDTLSQLLGFLGARFDVPKLVVDGKSVEMTPLVFSLVDIPLGKVLIGPLVDLFRTSIEDYYQKLRDSGCTGQSSAQLVRLIEGIASGNGSIKLSVGGVSAKTDDTYYPPIVLDEPTPPPTEAPATTAAPLIQTVDVPGTPAVAGTPAVEGFDPSTDELASSDDTTLEPVPDVAVEDETEVADDSNEVAAVADVASSRRVEDGDTGGAAALVGYLGVLLAVALAAADRFSMVRGRRRVIEP